MIKRIFIWLLLSTCSFLIVSAQTLTNDKIDILPGSSVYYLNEVVYTPANFSTAKTYPLVLFFHGMGEAGTDVTKMYNTGLPKVLKDGYKPPFDFIMVAPQATSYSLDPKYIQQVLDETFIKFPNIDQSRIYITGLSAGGFPVYGSQLNIDTTLAKKFAAIVIMSGATQDAIKSNIAWWKISKTPLWAVVGNLDISYRDQNQDMVNQVNGQVPNLAFITIRDGIGHGGWDDVYDGYVKTPAGQNMWDWMYQFTKTTSGYVNPVAPVNVPPTASAGVDQTITLPTSSVQLSGTASDSDGSIASYSWTKISGPSQFTFSSTSIGNPSVSNLAQGTYTFRLTVTDNQGATAYDDVNVIVNAAISTPPPPTGTRYVKVNVYGGSNACTNTEWNNWNIYSSLSSGALKYNDGTSSNINASLSQQNSVSDNGTSFSATMAPNDVIRYASYSSSNRTLTISGLDNNKTYNLELYASRTGASNNTTRFTVGATSIDIKTDDNMSTKASFATLVPSNGQITVSISKLNTYNYINGWMLTENASIVNTPPTANAGADQTITLPTSSVQLNGIASDPDGSIASYNWTKISGPSQFTFSSTSVANPSVSNLAQGTYTFRLTVTDNQGATAYDDVNVVVNAAVSIPKYVRVNIYGGTNPYNNTAWNNWNVSSSLSSGNLKYDDGSVSSINVNLSQQKSVSDNGTSFTATMAPNEVIRYASYSTTNRTLTISGLDNSKTYNLEIYASRTGASNNTTRFTIGASSIDVKTDDNMSTKASFASLVPSNGQITVSISKLNTYNYINGFMITEK